MKNVRRLDKPTAMRVLAASHRFADSGEGDVKGSPGKRRTPAPHRRLRLFFVCPAADTIEVRRVFHGREAYR